MKQVVYREPSGEIVGTTRVVNGRVLSTGVGEGDAQMTVVEPGTFKRLTPADGDAWLHGLLRTNTPYLRVTVEDVEGES